MSAASSSHPKAQTLLPPPLASFLPVPSLFPSTRQNPPSPFPSTLHLSAQTATLSASTPTAQPPTRQASLSRFSAFQSAVVFTAFGDPQIKTPLVASFWLWNFGNVFGGDNLEINIQCNMECGVYCLCCWAFDVKCSVAVTTGRKSWESGDRILVFFFSGKQR